jgi:hypothetical protein
VPAIDIRNFRPADLCRLLNASGEVLTERQLISQLLMQLEMMIVEDKILYQMEFAVHYHRLQCLCKRPAIGQESIEMMWQTGEFELPLIAKSQFLQNPL